MHPLELNIGQMDWAAGNIAYNLDFIPDDKLNWKPAPTASSALEMIGHILGVLNRMTPLLRTGTMGSSEAENPTDRESAKTQLLAAAKKYTAAMRDLSDDKLDTMIELPMGALRLGVMATMPVMDMVHHHGQIAYIQMLLGDVETHRDWSLMPN